MTVQIETSTGQDKNRLSICHDCDVLLLIPELNRSEKASCPRCGAQLGQGGNENISRLLPLTITGFILFTLANLFPLLSISASGQIIESTLLSSTFSLWNNDQYFLAIVVFVTTFMTPLLQLLANAWILVPQAFGQILPFSDSVLRLGHHSIPWNMMEIFLLGFLVAVVKLGEMAVILPGPSLYAFIALIVLMTTLSYLFEPARVWEDMHHRDRSCLT